MPFGCLADWHLCSPLCLGHLSIDAAVTLNLPMLVITGPLVGLSNKSSKIQAARLIHTKKEVQKRAIQFPFLPGVGFCCCCKAHSSPYLLSKAWLYIMVACINILLLRRTIPLPAPGKVAAQVEGNREPEEGGTRFCSPCLSGCPAGFH